MDFGNLLEETVQKTRAVLDLLQDPSLDDHELLHPISKKMEKTVLKLDCFRAMFACSDDKQTMIQNNSDELVTIKELVDEIFIDVCKLRH